MKRRFGTLTVSMALVSSVALAADQPSTIVEVQGEQFAAFVKQGVTLAVPTPAQSTLVRDSAQLPPDCEQLDAVLTGSESDIERCKIPGNANSRMCRELRNLVTLLRFDQGTIGHTALNQGWSVEPASPVGGPSADDVRRGVAIALGVGLDTVQYRPTVTPTGAPTGFSVEVTAGGTSWASQLDGFVDLNVGENGAPAVTYHAPNRRFVTKDHVVACGLYSGEAQIVWNQSAAATAQATLPGPFSAADLYRVYTTIAGSGPFVETDPVRHAIEVGARVGAAIQKHNLAGDRFDEKVRFVVNAFFRGEGMPFEAGLSRTEVERRAVGTVDVAFDIASPWSSTSAR
jgi:hypothetical protein